MIIGMEGNFEHLADADPQVARLGQLAEHFFHADPPSCIGKTRQLAELLAKECAARAGIGLDPRASFEDVLRRLRDHGLLPREVGELFHYLRRTGNLAIHENKGSVGDALTSLKIASQVAAWFRRTFLGNPGFRPGPFRPPTPPIDVTAQLRAEIEQLRQAVREQGSAAQRAVREIEEARRAQESAEEQARRESEDRKAAEQLLEEVEASRRLVAVKLTERQQYAQRAPPMQLVQFQTAAEAASSAVELDEADTRRLIDARLREAGWAADSDNIRHSAGSRPNIADAVAIAEWPTETGQPDRLRAFLGGPLRRRHRGQEGLQGHPGRVGAGQAIR